MELRLRAEARSTGQYGPVYPTKVTVSISTIEDGFVEVLSLPCSFPLSLGKYDEEIAVVQALRAFGSDLEELTSRVDALVGIADKSA